MKQQLDLDKLVNLPRLTQWLGENIPSLGDAPLAVELVHGGTSNVILSLNRGKETLVLRRPPLNPPKGSTKSIEREANLLSALSATDVPHPRVFGKCFDPNIIGDSFYVMERVEGWAPELETRVTHFKPPFDQGTLKSDLAYAMMDGLIALSNVDYKAVGLEHFGKPEGFLDRQVSRWGKQLDSYKTTYQNYHGRDIPGLHYVAEWLHNNIPEQSPAGILHGDYGFPNVMFCNDKPARLAAMIDWELATIGDPLMDLGWYLNAFRDERDPARNPQSTYFDAENFPTRQQLARYYAKHTGRNVDNLDYYIVLALYKGACICEYKVAAAMDGLQSKAIGDMFTQFVLDNAAEAERVARLNS